MKSPFSLPILCLLLLFTTVRSTADMLDSWHWRNPSPFANSLRGICFGAGKFVAVGDGGVIHTSLDRAVWDVGRKPVTSTLRKVIFANGQFVAVGDAGAIVTSSDGCSWTNHSPGTANALYSVTYGNGRYVACGVGGLLMISTNGSDWLPGSAGTNNLGWIAFGNGVFILPDPSQQFISGLPALLSQRLALKISGDAQTWTTVLLPMSFPIQSSIGIHQVEFGNGVFVAVVQDEVPLLLGWGPCHHFYQSDDGTNWVQGTVEWDTGWLHCFLTFSDGLFYEFTTGSHGGATTVNTISSTFDGTACGTILAPNDATDATYLAYANGRHVLTSLNGELWTSPDAANWTSDYSGLRGGIYQILRGGSNYIVLAGSQPVLVSADGMNFTAAPNSPAGVLSAVAFDGTNYVAVGGSGDKIFGYTGEVYTSTNSTDWVRRTSNATQQLGAICRGPTRWVAVGGNGTVISSPNTLSWTLRSSGTANSLSGVAFGNDVYVAVGNAGTIITSPDGSTWDVQYSGTTANLVRVRFLNGRFLVVAANGTLLASTNGSDWSILTSGTSRTLNDVTYGNGYYLACGYDNVNNVVLESTNGMDWQDITTNVPVSVVLNSVAFLDGSFWLCGANGALLQSDSADGIPRLAGATLAGNAGFQLKILLNVPPTYRIQVATNLAANSWQDVVTNSAPTSVWTDTNVSGSSIRMYRIASP